MKYLIFIITALALAALACSFSVDVDVPRLKTGPTETITLSERLPDRNTVGDVSLTMGAGELIVSGGAQEAFLEGELKYNVAEWKPTITQEEGRIAITQGEARGNFGFPDGEVVNDWTLKFGDAPMELTVNAGAYTGQLDLTGLNLRNLTINDGAGTSHVTFDSPNLGQMEQLRYTTGASTVTLNGLANANFEAMRFKGGAGAYTLDFSGELQREATVDIEAGVCTLTIVVPQGTPARIVLDGSLTTVKTEGKWSVDGDVYEKSGTGPVLTINVELGAGTLTLVNESE